MPKPRWSEITAIFGGRFDPPHLGHREAIRGLFRDPGIARVWILPTPTPPHKRAVAPFERRCEMVRLGLLGPGVTLDLREAGRNPAYTFDTLTEIRKETDKIAFVIGADQLVDLPSWNRFPKLLSLSHWIVLGRKPDGLDRAERCARELEASGLLRRSGEEWEVQGAETVLKIVRTDAPAMSSTEIREAIALEKPQEKPYESMLDPAVFAYLKLHRLYGT